MEKSLQEMKKTLIQQMSEKPIKILDLEKSLKKLLETKKTMSNRNTRCNKYIREFDRRK